MGINHSSNRQKVVLNEEIKQDDLIFSINEKEKTADIIGNNDAHDEVFIPRSIIYKAQEYTIISIKKDSFKNSTKIYSIQFPDDSKLKTIEENAFYHSNIKTLMIPSSLENLNKG